MKERRRVVTAHLQNPSSDPEVARPPEKHDLHQADLSVEGIDRADIGQTLDAPPVAHKFDVNGLDIAPGALDVLLKVDVDGWLEELPLMEKHYESFGDHLPKGLWTELAALEKRLLAART